MAELLSHQEQRYAEADRVQDEAMPRIRAAQIHLAALKQKASPLKRPRSADAVDEDGPGKVPFNKRASRDERSNLRVSQLARHARA